MSSFQKLGLNENILTALESIKFTQATPIQEQAIPHVLTSNRDLIAFASTGTGKTAAFSLPILQKIDPKSPAVQALILCPTRELCLQITRDIENFSKQMPLVSAIAIYGGDSISKQLKNLRGQAQIIVGTPGRVADFVGRKRLDFSNLKYLVLDEADEMLSMGFKDELDEILSETPKEKQTLLFSATMPKEMEQIAKKYIKNPVEISVNRQDDSSAKITHIAYKVTARHKYEVLKRIMDFYPDIYGIVFCRTKAETEQIAEKLLHDRYPAELINGDLSQNQRELVMSKFRRRQIQVLVATDVAARGIDVKDLTHVINYSMPESSETYVHRSGRTGRAHAEGISLVLVEPKEARKITFIEKKIGRSFQQGTIPSGKAIVEKRLFHLVDKIKESKIDENLFDKFSEQIEQKFSQLSREEIIKYFVSMEVSHFLESYGESEDLNEIFKQIHAREGSSSRDNSSRRDRDRRGNFGRPRFDRPRRSEFSGDKERSNFSDRKSFSGDKERSNSSDRKSFSGDKKHNGFSDRKNFSGERKQFSDKKGNFRRGR
jgi:ATP-dependent RNA helicase DeaD